MAETAQAQNDAMRVDDDPEQQKSREWAIFLFITVLLGPALAVAIVGGYGFIVWMYQIFAGPPGL